MLSAVSSSWDSTRVAPAPSLSPSFALTEGMLELSHTFCSYFSGCCLKTWTSYSTVKNDSFLRFSIKRRLSICEAARPSPDRTSPSAQSDNQREFCFNRHRVSYQNIGLPYGHTLVYWSVRIISYILWYLKFLVKVLRSPDMNVYNGTWLKLTFFFLYRYST